MNYKIRIFRTIVSLSLLTALAPAAFATAYTKTGSETDLNNTANWPPTGTPSSSADTATINNTSLGQGLTASSALAAQTLTVSGSLSGGDVDVSGAGMLTMGISASLAIRLRERPAFPPRARSLFPSILAVMP
jgi:hypothetical protein